MSEPFNLDADTHLRSLGFVCNRYLGEWIGGNAENGPSAPTWCPPYDEYCDITDCETIIIDADGRVVYYHDGTEEDDSEDFS